MNNSGLSFQEALFGIPIALLYPFFFTKSIDVFTDRSVIDDMCKDIPYSLDNVVQVLDYNNNNKNNKNPEYSTCYNERRIKLGKLDTTKFIMLMVIGILGIIAGGMIKTKATKIGIGLGGIITIIYAISMYWNHIDEKVKVIVTGSGLALLIYLSIKLYQAKSFVDLFQFNLQL
jgi:hypothetical protein